jgi:hypothetical protein
VTQAVAAELRDGVPLAPDAIMNQFFQRMSPRLPQAPAARRAFYCRCGRPVFFGNTRCLACGTPLGYEAELAELRPLTPGRFKGSWRLLPRSGLQGSLYRRCGNFDTPAGCNWLVKCDARGVPDHRLCRACRLNRTIPDLAEADNALLWGRIEEAKRRLVSQLIALKLPLRSRVSEDLDHGLAFDLLRAPPDGPPVSTGHHDGIITLDLAEADDAQREARRAALHEPYRTLLGHLRHEVGHYYWQRLVDGGAWLAPFRELFGDERADYAQALKRHYDEGPASDWPLRHVSAYAGMHPWEDWAETWAHYLHMMDTLDTALSFGLNADAVEMRFEPFPPDALYRPEEPDAPRFLAFVNAWAKLTGVLNELSRSMGQPDFYPFVLPTAVVAKLQLVHLVVREAGKHESA